MKKFIALVLALVLSSVFAAETNAPMYSVVSFTKTEATVARFEWERIDTEIPLPNGMEKKQVVEVFKRFVVTCYDQGELVSATNTISKIVIRIVPIDERKTTGVPSVPPLPTR
jgi:hypothetical protein